MEYNLFCRRVTLCFSCQKRWTRHNKLSLVAFVMTTEILDADWLMSLIQEKKENKQKREKEISKKSCVHFFTNMGVVSFLQIGEFIVELQKFSYHFNDKGRGKSILYVRKQVLRFWKGEYFLVKVKLDFPNIIHRSTLNSCQLYDIYENIEYFILHFR